jgi:hypothetical protein
MGILIDLVIGLFFVYFVFSVICSSIVEVFAQFMQWRSKGVEQWIGDTFTAQQSSSESPEGYEPASEDESYG